MSDLKFVATEARDELGRWAASGGDLTVDPRDVHERILDSGDMPNTLKDHQKGFLSPRGDIHRIPYNQSHNAVAQEALNNEDARAHAQLSSEHGYHRVSVEPGAINLETHGPMTEGHQDAVANLMQDNPKHDLHWDRYTPDSRGGESVRTHTAKDVWAFRKVLKDVGEAKLVGLLEPEEKEFNPDQPRDERGRFASGGGGDGAASDTASSSSPPLPEAARNAASEAIAIVPRTMGKPDATGTMADPIYVDGDLDHAVKEIYAGHHVRLDQPVQVATLVDKLGEIGQDAEAKGDKAPMYDLGLVTVPGTNLFTQQSLGIPRVQMPQLSGRPLPGTPADSMPKDDKGRVNLGDAMQEELERQGYKVTHEVVPPENLRATQMDLVGPQVAAMSKSLDKIPGTVGPREIFVSKDNYVVDGHHQWAATVLSNLRDGVPDKSIKVARFDADIGTVLDIVNGFTKAMGIPGVAGPAVAKTIARLRELLGLKAFNESQPRDDDGRFASGGGGGSPEPSTTPARSSADILTEIRAIRAEIASREEGVPNLRDYGLDKRPKFEADVAAYHAHTAELNARMQALGYERVAAREREQAGAKARYFEQENFEEEIADWAEQADWVDKVGNPHHGEGGRFAASDASSSGGADSGGGGEGGAPAEGSHAKELETAAGDATREAVKSGKPEDDIKAADAYAAAAAAETDPARKAYFQATGEAWRKSATANRTPVKGKGTGKGKGAAHKKAAAAHGAAGKLGKAAKVPASHYNNNAHAEALHNKKSGHSQLMWDDIADIDMSMLPTRLGEGKLLVPGRLGPAEIGLDHPEYYRWLREIPEVKRFRLMVAGEDLLG